MRFRLNTFRNLNVQSIKLSENIIAENSIQMRLSTCYIWWMDRSIYFILNTSIDHYLCPLCFILLPKRWIKSTSIGQKHTICIRISQISTQISNCSVCLPSQFIMIIKPANENILIAYFPEDILILIFIFQQNYFGVSSETDTIGDMDLYLC